MYKIQHFNFAHIIAVQVDFTTKEHYNGIVEVKYQGIWGGICNNGWGEDEAMLICGEYYGLPIGRVVDASVHPAYNLSSGIVWFNNVLCSPSEGDHRLEHCNHDGWAPVDCPASDLAAVQCTSQCRYTYTHTIISVDFDSIIATCLFNASSFRL